MIGLMVLGLAVAGAGCDSGDGAGGGTDDAGALSRADYISRVDQVCRDFMEETDAFGEPENPQELADLLDAAIALAEETGDELRSIEPPPDASDVHRDLMASLDGSLAEMRNARRALEEGDFEAMGRSLDAAVDIGDDSDEAAKAYGFEVCGSESQLRE